MLEFFKSAGAVVFGGLAMAEAGAATGAKLSPEVARMLISPSTAAFPSSKPKVNTVFRQMLSSAQGRSSNTPGANYFDQIASLQQTVETEVLDRIKAYHGITPDMGGRLRDAYSNSGFLGREAEQAQLSLAAAKRAALDMLSGDKRLGGLIKDPNNKKLITKMQERLMGAPFGETVSLLESFGRAGEKTVSDFGDIFAYYHKENLRLLQTGRGEGARAPISAELKLNNSNLILGQMGQFGGNPIPMHHGLDLTFDSLTEAEKAKLAGYQKAIGERTGGRFQFNPGKGDLYAIKGEKGRQFRYAKTKINGVEINLPLGAAEDYLYTNENAPRMSHSPKSGAGVPSAIEDAINAAEEQSNKIQGHIYHRGKFGSSTYSPVGKVIPIDNMGTDLKPGVAMSGHDYIWDPEKGKYLDAIGSLEEGNTRSLEEILFSSGDAGDDAVRYMEEIDPAKNIKLQIAKKQSQILIEESKEIVGIDPLERFKAHRQVAAEQGVSIFPMAGAKQQERGIYHYAETVGGEVRAPVYTQAALGELKVNAAGSVVPKSVVPLGRRPNRWMNNPLVTGRGGSRTALRNQPVPSGFKGGGGSQQLLSFYPFQSGAFREMLRAGMNPFVTGAVFSTPRGQARSPELFLEGSRAMIDPLAEQQEGTFLRPARRAQIEVGSPEHGFLYNDKLRPFLEKVNSLESSDPEERQRIIRELQKQDGVEFEEGEALGQRRLHSGQIVNEYIDVGGTSEQGKVLLQDVIPTENGWKLAFAREVPAGAGKLEGGTKSNQHSIGSLSTFDQEYRSVIDSKYDAELAEVDAKVEEVHQKRITEFDAKQKGQLNRNERLERLTKFNELKERDKKTRVSEINARRQAEIEAYEKSPDRAGAIESTKNSLLERVRDESVTAASDEERQAYAAVDKMFSSDITHMVEGKEIYKEGNLMAVRGQQQYATQKLTGEHVNLSHAMLENQLGNDELLTTLMPDPAGDKDAFKGVMSEFHDVVRGMHAERYSENDTNALLVLLKKASSHMSGNNMSPEEQRYAFGAIFGLEQPGTGIAGLSDISKSHPEVSARMLGALGIDEETQKQLLGGIDESPRVYGLNVQTARDFALDSSNDAKLERRFVEEIFHSTKNETSAYYKTHKLVFQQALKAAVPLDRSYVSAVQEMAQGVGSRPIGEAGKAGSDTVLDLHTPVAPEQHAAEMMRRRAALAVLQEQGGYIKYSENSMEYIPSQNTILAASTKNSRSGRVSEDLKLKSIISRIFETVDKNVENLDDDVVKLLNEQFDQFRGGVFSEIHGVATHLLEAPMSGAKHETAYAETVNTRLPKHAQPYQMGFSRGRIDEMFDREIKRATAAGRTKQVEYLNTWRKDVLAGKAAMPILGSQSPAIGPEVASIYSGRYNADMDKQGGISHPQYGEWVDSQGKVTAPNAEGSQYIRMGGVVTGRSSADADGDTVLTMFATLSEEQERLIDNGGDVEEIYREFRQMISDPELEEQFNRQRSYSIASTDFNPIIKDALKTKLSAGGSLGLDEVEKAFMKWAGQSQIGQTSNAMEQLRFINRILEETGAVTQHESERMSAFFNTMEQNAVGFKHNERTLGNVFAETVGTILTEPNTKRRAEKFNEFFDSFFYTDEGGQKVNFVLPERTEEQMSKLEGGLARAKVTASTIPSSKKTEDVRPQHVINSLTSGEESAFVAAFETSPEGTRAGLSIGAVKGLPHEQQEAAKAELREAYQESINTTEESLKANNAAILEEAASRGQNNAAGAASVPAEAAAASGGGVPPSGATTPPPATRTAMNEATRATNAGARFEKAMQSQASIVAEDAKALLENKFARTIGFGAAAMAGLYALLTKGYDDEPLSDIPPPPSNYGMNGNAQIEPLTGGGSLVSDSYRRQSMDMSDAMGADYSESNIPAPTSIMKKSYLDGATARISSRSLNLDRTDPVAYARSLRQAIPGSSIGLNINTSYSVPSDLERKL